VVLNGRCTSLFYFLGGKLLPEDKMPEAEVTLRLAISLFLNASNLHKNYTLNKKTLLTEARN
jgi:hypothetical protein